MIFCGVAKHNCNKNDNGAEKISLELLSVVISVVDRLMSNNK